MKEMVLIMDAVEEERKKKNAAEKRANDAEKRANDAEARADDAEILVAKYKEKYGDI